MKYILIALFAISTFRVAAQEVPIDVTVNDLLKEIMQTKYEGKNTKIILWFPLEFWDVTANNDPTFTKSTVDVIKEAFSEYTIIVAVNATSTGGGDHTYPTYTETKRNIKLTDGALKVYSPLEDKDLSEVAIKFKELIAPVFSKMIGDMGSHAYLYFFKTAPNNTNSAMKNGSFKITLDNSTFQWALPLACMMPAKHCPVDQQKMHGDWLYCPYHGTKLTN